MANRKADETKEDQAFINDPGGWPIWPWLPLKRGNNELADKNLGVLWVGDLPETHARKRGPDDRWVVWHVQLFDLPPNVEAFRASPHTIYPTLDALLADGWRVD